jgi:uncharacterized membrane protein
MFLARRRAMIGASLAAMGSLGVVALYQVGLTAHLPDPPLPSFDADSVHGSDEAYLWLGTPDALLGLASYATTAILAAAGGPDRASVQPWIPLALAMKVTVDVATASALTGTALTQQHALSAWSLLVTGATGAMALLVVPEARAALASLYRAGDGRSERKEARTCWIT